MKSQLINSLIEEHHELKKKIIRLREFIKSEKYNKVSETQQYLIKKQSKAMAYYERMLSERIKDLL